MDAPPYSLTATSENGLPHGYLSVNDTEPNEESRRQKSPAMPSSPLAHHHRRHWSAASFATEDGSQPESTLAPAVTAPSATTAPSFHDPFPPVAELPPNYAPVDELARSFRLEAPFVHTTRTSNMPRYQLMQEFSRSGRPRKLHIRRLMASESRRSHSLPSSSLSASIRPRIRYDEDATMYSINCYELLGSGYKSYEMRGHRSSTICGTIKAEVGKSLLGVRWTKIWQMTKSARKDSLNVENEARMQKYGYHADHEWDKRLLFVVKKGVWEDGEGKVVARETPTGEVDICDQVGSEGWRRDLVVSCWIMRIWVHEGLRWVNDVKGW